MKQTTKDAIIWFSTGLLIMTVISLLLFGQVKKKVIRGCLETNVLAINDIELQCKVDVTKFKGELITKKSAILESDDKVVVDDAIVIKPNSFTITIDGK